jgi:hypothetical protein
MGFDGTGFTQTSAIYAALKSQQLDSIFEKNLLRENHAKSLFQTARLTSNAVRAFCFS